MKDAIKRFNMQRMGVLKSREKTELKKTAAEMTHIHRLKRLSEAEHSEQTTAKHILVTHC